MTMCPNQQRSHGVQAACGRAEVVAGRKITGWCACRGHAGRPTGWLCRKGQAGWGCGGQEGRGLVSDRIFAGAGHAVSAVVLKKQEV